MSNPERESISAVSPLFSGWSINSVASSTTRSSSVRPTMIARRPQLNTSLTVTTSPVPSPTRDSTTFSDSFRTTSWPRRRP